MVSCMCEKFAIFRWIASLFIKLLKNTKNSRCSSTKQTLNNLGMASKRTDLTLGAPRVLYISVRNSNSPASEDSDGSAILQSLDLKISIWVSAWNCMEMHKKQ